jgi:MFS transporter, DHA3 family, macrolide efflux protein
MMQADYYRKAEQHLDKLRREAATHHLLAGSVNKDERIPARPPTGMRGFLLIWLGQAASYLGSSVVTFGLTIWAWQETGQATALALVGFFSFVPTLLVSPFAGVLVDRRNRKHVMLLADAGSAFASLVTLLLYNAGALKVWHLYLLGTWSGLVGAFRFPAFSAAITTLLPKEQYAWAGGMRALLNSLAHIGGPTLAGILLAFSELSTLLVIELITFFVAVLTLLPVHIPSLAKNEAEEDELTHFWDEVTYGFRYIFSRRSVRGLTLTFAGINLFAMLGVTVLSAMILARSGNDEVLLGGVRSALGLGGLASGLFISLWGGPKHKVYGVLLGVMGGSVALTAMGLGQSFFTWAAAAFTAFFFFPMLDAFSGAIFQRKVPPQVQGRFFSALRVVSHTGTTLAYLLAGPLADRVLEPAMQPQGVLAGTFGWLVGTGAGAGMALIFVFAGVLGVLVGIVALLYKPVRDIETLLPDHEPSAEEAVPQRT